MFIVTLLEACLTFVRRRCFRALYGAGVGRFRRRPRAPAPDTAPQTTPTPALPVIIHKHYVIGPERLEMPRPDRRNNPVRSVLSLPPRSRKLSPPGSGLLTTTNPSTTESRWTTCRTM